jgi:hypothetical protein
MAMMQVRIEMEPTSLRLLLLAFGMDHPYRVIAQEEIFHSLPHINREKIKESLDGLAAEGLLTKFSSRYCFNKPIPAELRRSIEQVITPSGTVRILRQASEGKEVRGEDANSNPPLPL